MLRRRQLGVNYDFGLFSLEKYLPSALVGADYDPNVAIMVDNGVVIQVASLLYMVSTGNLSFSNFGTSFGLSSSVGMLSGALRSIVERCSCSTQTEPSEHEPAEREPAILRLT